MANKKAKAKAKARRKKKTARPAAKRKAAPKKWQPKKDGRPPGMFWPALSPYLTVRDASASLEFYARAFGFKRVGEVMRDAQGTVQHAGMGLGEAMIMFAPPNPSSPMQPPAQSRAPDSLTLYVYVPDVDKLAARAQAAGAHQLQAPVDQFWGDRIAVFKDPDGYHWTFATNIGPFDPSKAPH